jgi:ferredoxin
MPVHRVTVQPSGLQFEAAEDQTLIEAALAAGIELPRSCRTGTCRVCRCRLLQGAVAYRVEWPGLSPDEKDDGDILPCVAEARADLVLQVPLARRREG